jgi:hypothetical protein
MMFDRSLSFFRWAGIVTGPRYVVELAIQLLR